MAGIRCQAEPPGLGISGEKEGLQGAAGPIFNDGRYLALLIQRGARREAVIEDRASGALQPLFLPGNAEPRRLSLAPDARQVAVELTSQGSTRLQLYDLSGLLEPDLAPGLRESGGGPGGPP